MFDVTLACSSFADEKPFLIKAHQVILAASSLVLKHFMLNMDTSLNGFLYLSGIEEEHLRSIIDFVYSGQVTVERGKLGRFLEVAEELKVEGLIREEILETRKRPRTELRSQKSTTAKEEEQMVEYEDVLQFEEKEINLMEETLGTSYTNGNI